MTTAASDARASDRWNDTASNYPAACVHELVAAQARRTPRAVAVESAGERLTYGELALGAELLAARLLSLGVRREELVVVSLDRTALLPQALLGILSAGAAYVPVDPGYPEERRRFMLRDSAARLVVTELALAGSFPGVRTVLLDGDEGAAGPRPLPASDPEQLAYVIYTSGSSGVPKGVEVPHRALVNLLESVRRRPGLDSGDVLVSVTTLSFDIAGLELFLPLVCGARLVVAPAATVRDPRALARLLEESGATAMQATPTTWRLLVRSGWEGRPGLRALCGGEALPPELAEALLDRGLELWNMYGPTETTIWSSAARVRRDGPVTIGGPLANTTLHVLDEDLRTLPEGAEGELYIGGHGVARGYRNRPELTAERFVPDVFSREPSARLYRTGDLVKRRRDGELEYLGRLDQQLKVRGVRIEAGEVESNLLRHPGVAHAVAVARADEEGDAELVAYAVPSGMAVVSPAGLRRFLRGTLPEPLVPSAVVLLPELPTTPNGKVDRGALPPPPRERDPDRELIRPRTPLERRLVELWERELGIPRIGVTDDFFDLGVPSLVAARLFARTERDLGCELPLGALFRAPTIEQLARLLEQGREADASAATSLVLLAPGGPEPPIVLVHGGAGTVLPLAQLARRLCGRRPVYGLQARGLYGGPRPLRSVEEMAQHYLTELRAAQPSGPYRLVGYCFGGIVAFQMAQLLVRAGEEVELLALLNAPSPAWLARFGWYGNQPGRRIRPRDPARRLLVALRVERRRSRRRLVLLWARLLLALGRPLPERVRDDYFVWISANAQTEYRPQPYPGRIVAIYGEGLYDEPEFGWTGLAGIESHAVPGEHTNNRQLLNEPHAAHVARLLEQFG
jgi:amino acid adenylation domain-containing protein